jgi:hypothetical protein
VVNVDRYYNVDGVEFGKLTAWDGNSHTVNYKGNGLGCQGNFGPRWLKKKTTQGTVVLSPEKTKQAADLYKQVTGDKGTVPIEVSEAAEVIRRLDWDQPNLESYGMGIDFHHPGHRWDKDTRLFSRNVRKATSTVDAEKGDKLYELGHAGGTRKCNDWRKAFCAVTSVHARKCHPAEHNKTRSPEPTWHVLSRLAARTGSLPGSAITRPVFGKTVSSGIIDGDPTEGWVRVRVQGKCTPALDNIKFVTDEGKLTRSVGQPKDSPVVAMIKAKVCLMDFNFAAFQAMEVCVFMVVTCLVIVKFMFGVSIENIQNLCGQIISYCDPGWFTQQQHRGDNYWQMFPQDPGRW